MRLFAALPLSSPAMERLTGVRLRLSKPGDGLRWSSPEQWHITLQFFGDLPAESVACLEREFSQATLHASEVVLEGLGLFTAKGILYVSVLPSPSLQLLHEQVGRLGEAGGVPLHARPFRPHITLARSKGQVGQSTLQGLSSPYLPPFGSSVGWTAERCLLLESRLWPHGAEYMERVSLPLVASPAEIQGIEEIRETQEMH